MAVSSGSHNYWRKVTDPPASLDLVTLFPNGDFSVSNLVFDQWTEIDNCRIGRSVVDKASGMGEILRVYVEQRGTLIAKFEDQSWFVLVQDNNYGAQ